MKVSSQKNYNLSFNARLLSQWRCCNAKNKIKNVSIVAIEKKDLPFIEKFVKYIKNLKIDNSITKEIMNDSSKTILEILRSNILGAKKIKIYIATYDEIPCGIFIANIPKSSSSNKGIVYSSRHNPAKKETEIDWLVTWKPTGNENIKGIGKALVGEYFRTVKKDKFRDVFVRSEIPEKSFAKNFYEHLGFERFSEKRLKLSNKNSAQCLVHDFSSDSNDETIPMIITRKNLEKTAEIISTTLRRQVFVQKSENAKNLILI